jgi:hypothetical protein
MLNTRQALVAMGWGRVAIGAGLLLMPRRSGRAWLGHVADDAGARAGVRAIGGRDLALGLGLVRADLRKEPLTGWVAAGALADATDAEAMLLSYRHLPSRTRLPILILAAATAATEVALGMAVRTYPRERDRRVGSRRR